MPGALTIAVDEATLARVDAAAAERETTREQIAEIAVAAFLLNEDLEREDFGPLQDWQIADIEVGLAEAESGQFASDEEVKAIFDRYRS